MLLTFGVEAARASIVTEVQGNIMKIMMLIVIVTLCAVLHCIVLYCTVLFVHPAPLHKRIFSLTLNVPVGIDFD